MIDVKSLTGGPKHKFLKEHRETILNCADIFGDDWVKREFNLGAHYQDTLDQLRRRTDGKGTSAPSKADRAFDLAVIARAGNAELRQEVREMREEFGQLVQVVVAQLAGRIIQALGNMEVEMPQGFKHIEGNDPLKLSMGGAGDTKPLPSRGQGRKYLVTTRRRPPV